MTLIEKGEELQNKDVGKYGNKTVTNSLLVGTHNIKCTMIKGNGLSVNLIRTFTIVNPILNSTDACINSSTKCVAGTINVNANTSYDFYVIANSGTESILIMIENLGGYVMWDHDTKLLNGPNDALCSLNGKTVDIYTYR